MRFSTEINAPKDKVWSVLWNDPTYRKWTSVFTEGSYAQSDWQQGSTIKFLAPDGNGMYSTIEQLVPNGVMSFKHLGVIKGGVEQPVNEETKKWSGAVERYPLEERGAKTLLTVEMDMSEEHRDFFNTTFPKALEKVKELAEAQASD